MATTILLVRHGQTEWNRVERFRGRADIPLNETGLIQADLTARRIAAQWKPAAVFTSPLGRARQTAESIAKRFSLSPYPVDDLTDIDYGQWQGKTPEEARERWPESAANWYEHPERAEIPGGETLSRVRSRAMSALQGLCELHRDRTIVLVSHTVVNRLILSGILGVGNERFWNLRQDPCAINVFELQDQVFTLCSMNDTCHLKQ